MSLFTRVCAVLVCLQLALSGSASAQYRPPPMSAAERFIAEGDELRVGAAKAASFRETETAEAKLKEAIEAYEKALAADPKAVTAATGLALACATLKDWDRIIKVLTPHQVRDPRDVDLSFHLGVALLKKRKYAEASTLLDVAGAADRPDLFIAHYYLGWLALQRQDATRTVTELGLYLRERPKEVAANDHDIHELTGRAHLLLKEAGKARSSFEAAQQGRPESVQIQMGLVAVLELEGKAPAAKKLLEGLLVRFPKAPAPRERLGRVVLQAGDAKRAESLARELLALQDSAAAHLLMADVHLAFKRHPQAETELRASLSRAPGQPGALVSLATVLQIQGRHDQAIAVLAQANAGPGSQAELLAALGTVYRRAGRHPQAIATHQELVRLAPPGARAHLLLGADYFASSQWDAAIATYTTALEREPGHAKAKHWLATALGRRAQVRTEGGLLDDAIADLRRAVELERGVKLARSLGALLLTQGQFEDGKSVLAQAVELPGAGWQEHHLLAWAHLGAQDVPGALAGFERAAGLVKEPEAQGQIGSGWGAASLEAGEFDDAVKRLTESAPRVKAAEDNLPLAWLRRGVARLRTGNVAGAQADLELVAKASKRTPELEDLSDLLRGLVAIEQRRPDLAQQAFRKALPAADKAPATLATRAFLDAYLEYRKDRTFEARKKLAAAKKLSKGEGWPELSRANSRRDGELAYGRGSLAAAERAFKEALHAGDPFNSYVVHNLACVHYRKGSAAQAAGTWRGLVGAVPEATLNLGIAAHLGKDLRQAATYYGQYRGSHSGLAREWRDRLAAIYGYGGTAADDAPAEEPAP